MDRQGPQASSVIRWEFETLANIGLLDTRPQFSLSKSHFLCSIYSGVLMIEYFLPCNICGTPPHFLLNCKNL